MSAALTTAAHALGSGLAHQLAAPEAVAPHRGPHARDIGVSFANPDGPNAGSYWLDIVMQDGRHISAVLPPELLAKLAAQATRQAS